MICQVTTTQYAKVYIMTSGQEQEQEAQRGSALNLMAVTNRTGPKASSLFR